MSSKKHDVEDLFESEEEAIDSEEEEVNILDDDDKNNNKGPPEDPLIAKLAEEFADELKVDSTSGNDSKKTPVDSPLVVFAKAYEKKIVFLSAEHPSPITAITKLLERAEHYIFISIYTFTFKNIKDTLLEAIDRGVTLTVIFDKGQMKEGTASANTRSIARELKAAGAVVYSREGLPKKSWHSDKTNYLNHVKIGIIDDSVLFHGSTNLTWNSDNSNLETLSVHVVPRKRLPRLAEIRAICTNNATLL